METRSEKIYPSVSSAFSKGWETIFGKAFIWLLITSLIVGFLDVPSAGMKMDIDELRWPFLLLFPVILMGIAYSFLFLPVLKYGCDYIFLEAVRNNEIDLMDLFNGFKTKYLNIILSHLIVVALTLVGLAFLIIPGIIVACRLVFVPYLVMDKNLDPMRAVEKSWELTRGHGWKIFFIGLLSIPIFILGLMAFIVGVIISSMWMKATFAALYQAVLDQEEDENPIPILGVDEV